MFGHCAGSGEEPSVILHLGLKCILETWSTLRDSSQVVGIGIIQDIPQQAHSALIAQAC